MSTEFTREDRYIVFKLSDVERFLTDADRAHLAMMKNEIDAGRDCANKPPFKGLIVESDWPEYEPTWKAIEARVTGTQSVPEESAIQVAARIMNLELIRERDALRAKIEAMEKQEPVAWRTFDGEGGYDFRSYEGNENYKLGWDARNPHHAGWVEPLYALPGAQPAPSIPDDVMRDAKRYRFLRAAKNILISPGGQAMTRSAAIAAAYMLAVSQGGAMLRDGKTYGPADYLQPRNASHDAERIAKAEAKRARKAAKRLGVKS